MLLKPGQKVTVNKDNHRYEAAVLNVCDDSCSLNIQGASCSVFSPSEKMIMELAQWEDALYLIHAVIKRAVEEQGASSIYLQCAITGQKRIQRRRAERMTVRIPAEYTPLPQKNLQKEMRDGFIHNISYNGVLISVKNPLQVGDELLLLFEIKINREKVSVGTTGTVVRIHGEEAESSGYPYSYGIKFKNPQRLLAG